MAEPKSVPLIITSAVKIDGEHYGVGDLLPSVDPELAKELAGQGRARLASDDEVAKAQAAKAKANKAG